MKTVPIFEELKFVSAESPYFTQVVFQLLSEAGERPVRLSGEVEIEKAMQMTGQPVQQRVLALLSEALVEHPMPQLPS